ncbi:MAG TPA: glycogen/starch synthase [Woeseiaceae bacterium]|nr:glycogen/starch synthase [Woeseiaceae bacterium]
MFVAAENGALPGAKVGGVADVIRDLPPAVAAEGWRATVVNPSYGSLHRLPGARALARLRVPFRGSTFTFTAYSVPANRDGVDCVVLDHPLLVPTEPGVVYHGDADDRPYATDAGKFAFFCAAVAAWLGSRERRPDALHLHDWHCGVLTVLRAFEPRFAALREVRTAFTIHNLAYQGQRPKRGDVSALDTWFPALAYTPGAVADPANAEVFNPMAAAIRLADRVNAVSPTYAREVQRPSAPEQGFVGGEGLESILRERAANGALIGILNGCEYPQMLPGAPDWPAVRQAVATALEGWQQQEKNGAAREAHRLAAATLARIGTARPRHLLTSVGRIVDQKMRLFFTGAGGGRSALAALLDELGNRGLLVLLGTGDSRYEALLVKLAGERTNLLFLRGYSEALSAALYAAGDLFLMPSSFEPCGISQMLAMRSGQPCVVHGVGGLRDTVEDELTGFVFEGGSPAEQAGNFVSRTSAALALRERDPARWDSIRRAAAAQRFDWSRAAKTYIREMYARP